MKNYITILLILFVTVAFGQDEAGVGYSSGASQGLLKIAAGQIDQGGGYFTLNNIPREIEGTIYLFDDWNNYSVIHLVDNNKKLLLRNLNINIQRNTFESKISQDSIYIFNPNNIDKMVINNTTYKNVYSDEGKRIYEVIYESNDFALLKGFSVRLIQGSPNPMVNRKTDKYVRNESYYIKKHNKLSKFKFKKATILKILEEDTNRLSIFEKYMKDNDLSYKHPEEVVRALNYSKLNSVSKP